MAALLTVKAFAVGFFDCLRNGGDVFEVPDTEENRKSSWFAEHVEEKLADNDEAAKTPKTEKAAKTPKK